MNDRRVGRPSASDEELMARFRGGEASAFDELLDRHRRPIYAYLRRSTPSKEAADDLFQEVFLRVIQAAPRWEEKAKVTTWLYTIARNLLIDASRRVKTTPPSVPLEGTGADEEPQAPIDRIAAPGTAPDAALLEREGGLALEALVAALPEEQRSAFLLKREGLTFDAIAEVSGISKNTIKSRLRYALEKLRAGLAARGLLGATEGER